MTTARQRPSGAISGITRFIRRRSSGGLPSNGELLDRAEAAGYEILITTDQNMKYQQNLSDRGIGTVVLMDSRWPYVRLRTADIRAALNAVKPGEAREVPIR